MAKFILYAKTFRYIFQFHRNVFVTRSDTLKKRRYLFKTHFFLDVLLTAVTRKLSINDTSHYTDGLHVIAVLILCNDWVMFGV